MQKSFSLIELMVVIVIIGIISAIAVPNYRIYTMKTDISNAITYAASLKAQALSNYEDHGKFSLEAPDSVPYYVHKSLSPPVGIVTGYYIINKPNIDTYFRWQSGGIGGIIIDISKENISIRNGTIGNGTNLGFVAHENNGIITWQCHTISPSNVSGAWPIRPELMPPDCIETP